jgi:hypothetical protein
MLFAIKLWIWGLLLAQAWSFSLAPRLQASRPSYLCMGKTITAQKRLEERWFPQAEPSDDDIYRAREENTQELEISSLKLLSNLIRKGMQRKGQDFAPNLKNRAYQMAKGKFIDLTCTGQGERVLENLFSDEQAEEQYWEDERIILGAITALQSLCIMATQVGVKGTPEQLKRMVAHLETPEGDPLDVNVWDSVKRLKYQVDQTAGTQYLSLVNKKRNPKGAFDVLVSLGAWDKHENLPLLRSGFPIRFTPKEEEAAITASMNTRDPDAILGLRQDFRREKVYTIDSASTVEIDDGLSLEVISNEDGSTRQRFWIHIADADRWAPRDSEAFQVAARRATSLYLPSGTIPMLPSILSSGKMSLKANSNVCALSIAVELNPDGSIDSSSIVLTPSLIRVSYRLSYDEVDEMLEEGVGYSEEWQLGAMLAAANKRRSYRMNNGSSEAMIPYPIPYSTVSTVVDEDAPDGVGIKVTVEVSHNAGKNQTANAERGTLPTGNVHAAPASPAFMLVTEMMIMAGEAVGKWKAAMEAKQDDVVNGDVNMIRNTLKLPFRGQPKPDFQSRGRERRIWNDLLESMAGDGYCHAWYGRWFFSPVKVSESLAPHHGLGLDCYVQWTSPIRRFGDLQAHGAIKRFIRRNKINELMKEGKAIPSELSLIDIGCKVPVPVEVDDDGRIIKYECSSSDTIDSDIDFGVGQGLIGAGRHLQRRSQQYWLFEYISRLQNEDPEKAVFDAIVLGCVDYERDQYAIYLPELGLEHRYLSQKGSLEPGEKLRLKVATVYPSTGLMSLTLANQ